MNVVLAVAAVLVAVVAVRALHRALPPRRRPSGDHARNEATEVGDLARLERAVSTSTASAGDAHTRLRPILREIAADGLHRRGVDLDTDPAAARALLAPETWELVRPDRPRPEDPFAGGIAPAELDAVLDDLEALLR